MFIRFPGREAFLMTRLMTVGWLGSLILAYMAGYVGGPAGSAAADQAAAGAQQPAAQAPAPGGALPPGDYSRMQIAPDQGEPTHFSGAALRKAHTELQNRAKNGQAVSNPRDLMKPLVTRTHSYILLHRSEPRTATQTPSGEQHEGVADVYVVTGGSGTVVVGGEIENKRISRPGEYLGPIKGGKPFKLQAGDILNIPANTPHGTIADAGGMTYVLMKVNVGLYPWSLINGTP
jgi:mannose-6-phosphate isomerase-like protein (cupin superfamily)